MSIVEYLQIGKITRSHGVKGEIKVLPLTDDPERFDLLKHVYMDKGTEYVKYHVEGVKYQGGMVILKLEGINDMDAAEALRDKFLLVDRGNSVKLPDSSFFICDILGCEVFEENGNRLGLLKDVLKTGSNDVYVVAGTDENEILIPALKSVVQEVDIHGRRITVKLPEGLVEG